ncbi:ATP-dependent helicase [Reticulomyxa filosa]|uniref:ATP-dependent helicase n=1 Tax=Reticulomyxa filosa TaxID=46433 RepID=X6MHB9_RETFI|nr:ATP-dependent helicase [Reticulomyxa filosa]|eukprot:ETO13284.1 ATP-dependent helicase [Reticulomyxa filosa]
MICQKINVPKRKIGEKTLEKLESYRNQHNLSLFQACEAISANNKDSSKHAPIKFGKVLRDTLRTFVANIRTIEKMNNENNPLSILTELINCFQYREYLSRTFPKTLESKLSNINELLRMAEANKTLPLKLLIDKLHKDSEEQHGTPSNKLVLSTIHAAKGLEWDNVFVIGCAMGLFPHYRALQSTKQPKRFPSPSGLSRTASNEDLDNADMEEERRLAFVAATRAKKRLFLSYAKWKTAESVDMPTVSDVDSDEMDVQMAENANTISSFFANLPSAFVNYNLLSTAPHSLDTPKRRNNTFITEKERPNGNQSQHSNPSSKCIDGGFVTVKSQAFQSIVMVDSKTYIHRQSS